MPLTLENLLQNREFEAALEGLESGELDPASCPSGIYYAARAENTRILKLLLDAGADPNHNSSPRPLQIAASAGLEENVRLLLAAGADPNAGTIIGTPLSDAVDAGSDGSAAVLVRAGAADGDEGHSLLAKACYHGMREAVRAMIEAGFDLAGRATIEPRALHQQKRGLKRSGEALAGLLELVPQLGHASSEDEVHSISDRVDEVEQRAAAAKEQDARAAEAIPSWIYDNAPPAVVAAGEGRRDLLELLITGGADPSLGDDQGVTPWAAASRAGHDALAGWIEKLGGRRDAERSADEELLIGAHEGDTAVVQAALARGADPDARDQRSKTKGKTPLLLAVAGGHQEVVAALLAGGASSEVRDRAEGEKGGGAFGEPASEDTFCMPGAVFGLTPLAAASALDQDECASRLLAAGADPNARDDLGYSCLHLAARSGSGTALRRLVAAGAEVDRPSPEGTALLLVACEGETELVRFLTQVGADPSYVPKHERTSSLHNAATLGDSGSVNALLDAGADATFRDEEGKTAYHVAKESAQWGDALDAVTLERLYQATGSIADEQIEDDDEDYGDVDLPELDDELAEHYDFEASRERLERAQDESFATAVAELAARCGSEARDLGGGLPGVRFQIHSQKAEPALRMNLDIEALQNEYLDRGTLVLRAGSFGAEASQLLVLPTTDPLEAIAAMGTNGANYDIMPRHILEFFRSHPAVVWELAHDRVVGRFTEAYLSTVEDLDELAREIYEICPDTIDQGVGSLEALAESLGESGEFYCWWD
ncbi:MAG: ankyrin repeat domain-containing protein [Thermoanaerobaculia bacterium]|nr:ankyrin repeat domain-containing protein [Thermoanaerobaculia bacterium]